MADTEQWFVSVGSQPLNSPLLHMPKAEKTEAFSVFKIAAGL